MRFEGEARPMLRAWYQEPGAGIVDGDTCLVDGVPAVIVGMGGQAVIVRAQPDLQFWIYVQRRPGDPYRLVGAATNDVARERMLKELAALKVREAVAVPVDMRAGGLTPVAPDHSMTVANMRWRWQAMHQGRAKAGTNG